MTVLIVATIALFAIVGGAESLHIIRRKLEEKKIKKTMELLGVLEETGYIPRGIAPPRLPEAPYRDSTVNENEVLRSENERLLKENAKLKEKAAPSDDVAARFMTSFLEIVASNRFDLIASKFSKRKGS